MKTFQMTTSGQKGEFLNFDKISPNQLWWLPSNWTVHILFPRSWVKSMLGKLTLKYVTPTLTKLSQSRLKAPEIQHLDEMFSKQHTCYITAVWYICDFDINSKSYIYHISYRINMHFISHVGSFAWHDWSLLILVLEASIKVAWCIW